MSNTISANAGSRYIGTNKKIILRPIRQLAERGEVNSSRLRSNNKLFKYWYLLVVLVFIGSILAQNADAAEFSQAYLRLDRTKVNTALSGTVCAKPSSAGAGTESKVLVSFPSDFSINGTAANYTTDTSNLPADATAWPGIGSTATSVTSQTVTFVSSDLTNGSTLYCFNFTGTSSTTSSSAGNDKNGNIMTRNSSNTIIDSSTYAVSITSNDQITVSATVPASASDYDVSISKVTSTPSSGNFPENTEIEYQLTYGTSLTYATNITLEGSWSQGTIEGNGSPSVDVLSYVTGSAGNAYGSTAPVIDTVNRTISWEISSFPGNTTGRTVNFKLKTTGNYTGSSRVSFTSSARILFPGGSTSYNNSSAYYKYSVVSSSSTSSPTSTPTPTPTGAPAPPRIQSIDVREISQDSASIYVQTDKATTKVIKYGKSISNLNFSASSALSLGALITLAKLDPDTKYFFKAYATDASKNQIISDIYTLTTAQVSEPLLADEKSFIAIAHDTILSLLVRNNYLVVPKNTVFQFKFSMRKRVSAKKVVAIVRNRNVLGLFSFAKKAQAGNESTDLIEVEPGVYSGNLQTKSERGNYEIYASITDTKNNTTEQKIADLRIINRFSVISKKDKKPLEGERVLLYILNPSSRTYQIIPSANILDGNPAFTDRNGELDVILPQAKYKAEISDLRYKDRTVEFEIGTAEGQEYPVVELEETEISLLHIIRYYLRTINDVFIYNTQVYSEILTGSPRFFDLLSAISLGGLVALTLFSFSKKHHIPVSSMFTYFYYLIDHNKRNEKYIHGVVYDESDKPIPGANVYLTDKENEKIVSSTKTDRHGEFFFKKGDSKYLLMAMAKNFKTSPLVEYHEKEHLKYKIILEKKHEGLNFFENAWRFVTGVFGMSFEGLAILTIIFQLLFINSFGLVKTLPFLTISIFNMMLWTLYLRHRHLITHHSA